MTRLTVTHPVDTVKLREELLDGAQDLVRRSRSPFAHVHQCATCPDALLCTQAPDRCAIPTDWQCVACSMDSQDAYFEMEARR